MHILCIHDKFKLWCTGQRMTTLNRDCPLILNDREPVNNRWFPNSLHPSGRDRQSRGVTIDQYRDPCAQGSHLETFRVSLPAYCPKIHSLPGGISKYLENQNREHGGCFTVQKQLDTLRVLIGLISIVYSRSRPI